MSLRGRLARVGKKVGRRAEIARRKLWDKQMAVFDRFLKLCTDEELLALDELWEECDPADTLEPLMPTIMRIGARMQRDGVDLDALIEDPR